MTGQYLAALWEPVRLSVDRPRRLTGAPGSVRQMWEADDDSHAWLIDWIAVPAQLNDESDLDDVATISIYGTDRRLTRVEDPIATLTGAVGNLAFPLRLNFTGSPRLVTQPAIAMVVNYDSFVFSTGPVTALMQAWRVRPRRTGTPGDSAATQSRGSWWNEPWAR